MNLKKNDKVALVALSNGLSLTMVESINRLVLVLEEMGLKVIRSPYLFAKEGVAGAPAKLRAKNIMDFYRESEVKAIFDVSGGDIANEVLGELDYEVIKNQDKPFFGYSDLTTVINALYSQAGKSSMLYQIRNMIGSYSSEQQERIERTLFEGKDDLVDFRYEFLQGEHLEGTVVGGNIRCLLKLAGTKFMPDFKKKILLLESRSGGVAQMRTFLNQYKQMGVFDQIKGIILGSFTQMESENLSPAIEELVLEIAARKDLPIVKTREIGHGADSKGIIIGEKIDLSL